jgi:molybdopterin-biosynthesis enzyme MoeA-like protein
MAQLPEGATMMQNPVGTAPASILVHGGAHIISLPGVPSELKGIVEGPLEPLLGQLLGTAAYREEEMVVDCGDESVLAPILSDVGSRHAQVYIKSRAARFGPDRAFRVIISATAASTAAAQAALSEAAGDLLDALGEAGIKRVT